MTHRAIVIGTGYAAEGHTVALREADVEVVALCGRAPAPARAMADKLGITDLRFDWRQAIEELRPDIVAITTPAPPHREMVEFAAQRGCHIACEKPLALTAEDARAMVMAVEQAQVKHAYAATGCYSPQFTHTRKVLAESNIGQIREIEYVIHMDFVRGLAYYWFHQLAEGGGILYQGLPHVLAQIQRITRGEYRAAAGEARRLIEQAAIGPEVHDWRDFGKNVIDPQQVAPGDWREVDADTAFTVLTQLHLPTGTDASVLFQVSVRAVNRVPNYLAFYGDEGTLLLTGTGWPEQIQCYRHASQAWQEYPVPHPSVGGASQSSQRTQVQWNLFFQEFMADVRGEGYAGYPTFRDGWVANQIMDIARTGQSWTALSTDPGYLS